MNCGDWISTISSRKTTSYTRWENTFILKYYSMDDIKFDRTTAGRKWIKFRQSRTVLLDTKFSYRTATTHPCSRFLWYFDLSYAHISIWKPCNLKGSFASLNNIAKLYNDLHSGSCICEGADMSSAYCTWFLFRYTTLRYTHTGARLILFCNQRIAILVQEMKSNRQYLNGGTLELM